MTPMTTWACMAGLPPKPSTPGEIKNQTPTNRLSHSSQTANAANAAIDITAMTIPLTTAFCEAAPLGKPKIQGATKRIPPRTRLATSQSLALLHSFMTSSFLYLRPPPALIALTPASQTDEIFDGRRVLLALSAVALAKPTPIERPRLALVNADTDMGSVVAMQENIGSIRAMCERDYFAAPQLPLNNFHCRLEPVPQDAPGSIAPVA